uniref:Uncharacterized protein n=1 Tax=Oryza nivara TaxID=4536 RepID=A0A0E0IBQ0_ORYNI
MSLRRQCGRGKVRLFRPVAPAAESAVKAVESAWRWLAGGSGGCGLGGFLSTKSGAHAFVLSVELLCILSASAKFVVVDLRLDLKTFHSLKKCLEQPYKVLEEKERQLGGMHHVVYTYKPQLRSGSTLVRIC